LVIHLTQADAAFRSHIIDELRAAAQENVVQKTAP
jgi:hypothetical protein